MDKYSDIGAIILAGGKGTRMGGKAPKVLQKLGSKPIIFRTLDLLGKVGLKNVVVVTGYKGDFLESKIKDAGYKVLFARQKGLLGTADAVRTGLRKVDREFNFVLVLFGDDSGLFSTRTISGFISKTLASNAPMGMVVIEKDPDVNPIGGLATDERGRVIGVMTEEDILKANLKKHLELCGALFFDRYWLEKNISRIEKSKISGEYPLPGMIALASKEKRYAFVYKLRNSDEWNSVNTIEELNLAREKLESYGRKV